MHINKHTGRNVPVMGGKVEDRFFVQTLITFKVGEKLFRVPQTGFESSFFVDQIRSCSQACSDSESSSCSDSDCEASLTVNGDKEVACHLIELKNVNPDEFQSFLKILIPAPLGVTESITEADFRSALKLATKFGGFDAVRDSVITGLENLDISCAQKINLAQEHNVPQWLAPAIFSLAMRTESLTADECRLIGVETIAQVALLRDRRYEILSQLSDPGACNAALAEAGIVAMDELIGARKKYAEEASPEHDVLSKMKLERDEVAVSLQVLTDEREVINKNRERSMAQALAHENEVAFQACKKKIEEAGAKITTARAVLSTLSGTQDERDSIEQWMRTLIGAEGELEAYKKEVADVLEAIDSEEPQGNGGSGERKTGEDQAPAVAVDLDTEQNPESDRASHKVSESGDTSEKTTSEDDASSTTATVGVPDSSGGK